MNNRPDDRTRLLAETLEGEWATGPAAAMAQRAASHARQRRAVKRASLSLAAAAALGAVILFNQRTPSSIVLPTPSPANITAAPAVVSVGYEIISDEEFLAAVHDRPLLVLPQENGSKKIVLLDH